MDKQMNDLEYSYLERSVLKYTGVDIARYKSQQMRRRLNGHISAQGGSVAEFCKMLGRDQAVVDRLKNFLTINVSEFFRDPEQFEALERQLLPQIMKSNKRGVHVWSAGCSIGAEPYSIAILLDELAPYQNHHILATDIDATILAKARNGGPYTDADLKNLPRRYLLKYFEKADGGYRVGSYLRGKVEFRKHDLLRDPFGHGYALIVCRNVIIYFAEEPKRRLFQSFRESLAENGLLFIGATEALLDTGSLGLRRVLSCFYSRDTSEITAEPTAKAKTAARRKSLAR